MEWLITRKVKPNVFLDWSKKCINPYSPGCQISALRGSNVHIQTEDSGWYYFQQLEAWTHINCDTVTVLLKSCIMTRVCMASYLSILILDTYLEVSTEQTIKIKFAQPIPGYFRYSLTWGRLHNKNLLQVVGPSVMYTNPIGSSKDHPGWSDLRAARAPEPSMDWNNFLTFPLFATLALQEGWLGLS